MAFMGSSWVRGSLWMGALVLSALLWFIPAMKERRATVAELSYRLEKMEREKELAALEKEELLLQIASQSDPAWIEMVLLRELGMVPDGFMKVHFKK